MYLQTRTWWNLVGQSDLDQPQLAARKEEK